MYICYMSTAGCRLGHVVAFAGAWTTHLCLLNFHDRIRIATSQMHTYIQYQALAALSPMTIGCGATAVVPLGLLVLVPRDKETTM